MILNATRRLKPPTPSVSTNTKCKNMMRRIEILHRSIFARKVDAPPSSRYYLGSMSSFSNFRRECMCACCCCACVCSGAG